MSGPGPVAGGPRPRTKTRLRGWALAVALLGILLAGTPLLPLATAGPASGPSPASGTPALGPTHPLDSSTPGWTTFHGFENRSGSTPFNGPSTKTLLWAKPATGFPIRVGVVSGNGQLYVADVLGDVASLNRTDGGVLWRASVGDGPTAPDLSGNNLYFGDGSGNITDLSATNGSRLWQTHVGAPVLQGLAVGAGSVFAATGAGRMVALDATNGSTQWSVTLPGALSGAPALEGSSLYVANRTGTVFRLGVGGSQVWSASVSAPVYTAVAVYAGTVYVADAAGGISALDSTNGSLRWHFRDPTPSDEFNATPAVAGSLLVATSSRGYDVGLNTSNGSVRWTRIVTPLGYPVVSGPALSPNGVYTIDASEQVDSLNLSTGAIQWAGSTGSSFSLGGPSVDTGQLFVGDEVGYVYAFGLSAASYRFPVSGVVRNATGVALSNATVSAPGASVLTAANGTFALYLPNGSYLLNVSAIAHPPTLFPVVVNGPRSGLVIVLQSLPLYPITGRVVDEYSTQPLPGVNVTVFGPYGYMAWNLTDAAGVFRLSVPNGSDFFTATPLAGYAGVQERVQILLNASTAKSFELVIGLPPTVLQSSSQDPYHWVIVLGMLATAAAVLVAGLGWRARRKSEENLSRSILTPFERFLAMRSILIVPQIIAILVILYVFGTFLPAAAFNQPPCSILGAGSGCSGCTWSNPVCVIEIFAQGFWTFLVNLFSGQWGIASYGNLKAPAASFIEWWGPYTAELAVVALGLAALIAYPLGLWAGWRAERPVDTGTRVLSIAALLVPSFLVVLLILGVAYIPFLNTVGDNPYGIIPSTTWFFSNGGIPSWIGTAGNTYPTGFPLVDGLYHQAWGFEAVTAAKTLFQAFLIAIVYIAIFLRFARHTVAEAVAEPHVRAARARGVSESRLLWYHTGRRVLPIFVLILGLTVPIYLGTQALVEALFNDPGLGTLLLAQMTNVQVTRFGYSSLSGVHPGNIYQVAIFFTALVVLLASLCADIVARLLDPRLAAGESV